MNFRPWASGLRTAFSLLTFYAVARQWVIHAGHGFNGLNFFSYFTNLANLFAAGVLLWAAWAVPPPASATSAAVVRAMAVINMLVVGVVVSTLLRDVDLGSLLPWVNFVLHYLMPCVVVLDWILLPPRERFHVRELLLCLISPLAYLSYVLIRGSFVGWYPYPFLNPANVGGYGGVMLYAMGIAVVFIVGGWALLALANRLRERGDRASAERARSRSLGAR